MGDTALLVEPADYPSAESSDALLEAAARVWAYAAAARELPGVLEAVPGARTVLIRVRPDAGLSAVAAAIARLDISVALAATDPAAAEAPPVEIPVRYDGPDLAEVAALTGLGEDDVVSAHTRSCWRVGFTGFAAGFGYLLGGDPRLHVPRRATPRPQVAAGAVGLAGPYSGVYPRSSPGGWQLIGRTEKAIWDPAADPPALLRPGAAVRFLVR